MSSKKIEIDSFEQMVQKDFVQKVAQLLSERYQNTPFAHVHSFGCQGNISDGEYLMGMLSQMGYAFTPDPTEADLVLYNTCAVRENAEAKVFGIVGELSHCKAQKPEMVVGLCGCMTQQQHILEKVKKSYPYVDLLFGTHVAHTLPEMLFRTLTGKERVFDISCKEGIIVEDVPVRREGNIKAWLPIMYGCDNFCSYCVVPYVRGREKSRTSHHILAQARELVAQGFKEITLLGQNVNSYGKGLAEEINFAQLLEQINGIEGDFWIRFMTSHPKDCTKELIDTIARCSKVCKHIHLPAQCGSDRVLQQMNRHYTKASYLELVEDARRKMPDISFTGDIMVGFPGETKDDFDQTLALIQQVRYTALYTFLYSPRKGTKAEQMSDPVPAAEKSGWFSEMLELQSGIGAQINQELVGKTLRVLVQGKGKAEGTLTARTEGTAIVDFVGDASLIGTFATVRITKALHRAVQAELVSPKSA